jgi:hypothetical protein
MVTKVTVSGAPGAPNDSQSTAFNIRYSESGRRLRWSVPVPYGLVHDDQLEADDRDIAGCTSGTQQRQDGEQPWHRTHTVPSTAGER